jgi:hypothetical protein
MKRTIWFFTWNKPAVITAICSFQRKGLVTNVEREFGVPWKEIYSKGGRATKCIVEEV